MDHHHAPPRRRPHRTRPQRARDPLPAEYVAEHVELAYAQTSHAAQGRTVDHSLLLVDGPTDTRGIYVPLTRGRDSNHVYVTCEPDQTPRDILETALSQNWIDVPATVRRNELQPAHDAARSHTPTAPPRASLSSRELRDLLETEHYYDRRIDSHDHALAQLPKMIADAEKAHTHAKQSAAANIEQLEQAKQRLAQIDRPLIRRRHGPEIFSLGRDIEQRERHIEYDHTKIDAARDEIPKLNARLHTTEADQQQRPEWETELAEARRRIEHDYQHRYRHAPEHTTIDIIDRLGPRPRNPETAHLWDHTAARLDQHQTAFGPLADTAPRTYTFDAQDRSRSDLDQALRHHDHTTRPRHLDRNHERDHDLGIEM